MDWRVGITVQSKYAGDPLGKRKARVLAVYPSGTNDIHDADGVLELKFLDSWGEIIRAPADRFVTA